MNNKHIFLPALCLLPLLIRCAVAPLAGGSDNPDFIVMGTVVDAGGQPAQNAVVTIVPASYNPMTDSAPIASMMDTTNGSGQFRLAVNQKGAFNVQAVHLLRRTRLLITGIPVYNDTNRVAVATLKAPGTIKISLPTKDINAVTGYIYVPGTSLCATLRGSGDTIALDSVPCGTMPSISYAATDVAGSIALRYNVAVASGDTTLVRNTSWKYCGRIFLNTTATGAGISGDVADFPVLIRLSGDNFDFSQATRNGADIRFTNRYNALLPYEIERWDPVTGLAEVWVMMDTVHGGDSTQSLAMYWGNGNAADSSSGAAVFDTAAGFAGVWHLGQPSGGIVPDATANGNNGTATATITVSGAVGMAQSFDGASSFIRAAGPSGSVLNFPENGDYSVSAWVNSNTVDSLYRGIVYKSNFEYGLQIRPNNTWEFFSFIQGTGWEGSRCPAASGSWHLLTGVRRGTRQYLYVDGACVDSAKAVMSSTLSRVSAGPLEIGHCPDGGLNPDRYFSGLIDEVRISKTAISADWIQLCYENQKPQDALVKWQACIACILP